MSDEDDMQYDTMLDDDGCWIVVGWRGSESPRIVDGPFSRSDADMSMRRLRALEKSTSLHKYL